jgi:hypothetical protein
VDLKKHIPPPRIEWLDLLQSTARQNSPAVYHPSFRSPEQRCGLEMRCVTEGNLIKEDDHMRQYYLNVGETIGASKGQETFYVYAEFLKTGEVHGRPITERELQRKGAKL